MSQVILKLAEGNKLNAQSNKNLIEIGTDKYDFNDLAKIYQTNDFDSFYLDQGFNEKDLPELRNYGKQYLEAFKNGKIKRNIDGSYTVSDPTLFTDNENPVKKTLFGKIKGDKKRVVLGYFDNLINQLSPYTESKEEVKVTPTESKPITAETKKTPFEYGYKKYLEKNIFKDSNKSDIEKDIWFNTEDKWKIATKAFNDYIQSLDGDYDFSNTSFSNKDEYIKVLNQLKSSIENKDLEAFKQALYDAGEADTFGYFITPEEYKLSKMTPEEQQKYLVQKQINLQKEEAKEFTDFSNRDVKLRSYNLFNPIPNWIISKENYPSASLLNPDKDTLMSLFENNDSDKIREFLSFYGNDYFDNAGYLNGLITLNNGIPTVWRKKDNTLIEELLSTYNPEAFKKWYNTNILKHQKGGIIKAQNGVEWNNSYFKTAIKKTEPIKTETPKEISTPVKEQNDTSNEFTEADYVRLGALVGDITSLGLSLSGFGAPASALTGAVSTAANQTADMLEGQTFGQSLIGNFGSYALDAFSLLPFAKSAKIPKMLQTLGKLTPKILGVITTGTTIANSKPIIESFNKVKNGEDLTVQDWKNIGNTLQFIIGGTAATHRASKSNSRIQSVLSDDHVWLKTNQGWKKVKKDDVSNIKSKSTIEEQNKVLENTTLPEKTNLLGKKKGIADINTKDYYDFNKKSITYSGELPLEYNFSKLEKWLGTTSKFPNFQWTNRFRTGYNWIFHPQAMYKNKNKNIPSAQAGVKFPITNTTKNPTYNRENNLLKSLEVESYLKSLTPDNYMQFNGYEDLYDKNYETTYGKGSLSQWGTHNTSKLDSNPMVKHMQYVWNSRELNNPIYKGFTGVGISGDNPQGQGQDSAMGNMTIERTLGHLTDDQARYLQTKLNPNLEFYKTNTGVYRIRLKQFHTPLTGKSLTINPVDKPLSVQLNTGQESLTAKLSDPFSKVRNWTPSSENINDFRYLLTNILNNKIKYNPSVLTTDAPQLSARVQYNLPLESFYNRQANQVRRLSNKTATADQDKNRAFNLDTEMSAQGLEEKGKLANMDTYLQTSKAAQDINNQNILYRVENANQNKARMVAVQEAKDAFERTKQLKKQQNLVNWLYGKQQRLYNIEQQNKAIESEMQQFKWQQDWNNMQEPFKKELEQASLAYNKENSNNSNAPAFETTDTYKKIMERFSLAQSNLYKKIMKEKADWQKQNLTLFKSGGSFLEKKVLQDAREYNKFLLNNNREMNKLIRLSITENNKTIRGLSNYSAQLIRDSLKLK